MASAVAFAACLPSANYEDPLSQIGSRSVSGTNAASLPETRVSPFKTLTLGVIFTNNSKQAMSLISADNNTAKVFDLGIVQADASLLTNDINKALKERFKDVVSLADFEASRSASIDAVMYLDIQVVFGTRAGTHTTVALQGIFVDKNKKPLGKVDANGSATMPLIAFSPKFEEASSQAVEHFAQELDLETGLADTVASNAAQFEEAHSPSQLSPPSPSLVVASLKPDSQRVALIIGNSHYQYVSALTNPTNDAQLMASNLQSEGFRLVDGKALLDLDKPAFERALQKFGDEIQTAKLKGATVALFYYAGHGMQIDGINYLVPISANPNKASDAPLQMVAADAALNEMQDGGARLKIVILDACRNNPFRSLSRGMNSGLASMDAPDGTLIAYATKPDGVAADGNGRDSPYSEALVESFSKPGLGLFDVFNEAALIVKRKTGDAQQPWTAASAIEGKFCFAGCAD
jgi:Caspase domain